MNIGDSIKQLLGVVFLLIIIWPLIMGFMAKSCSRDKLAGFFATVIISVVGNLAITYLVVKNPDFLGYFEQYGGDFDDYAYVVLTFFFPVFVVTMICLKDRYFK